MLDRPELLQLNNPIKSQIEHIQCWNYYLKLLLQVMDGGIC